MSMAFNGRIVTCDGAGCLACADVPIALRPMLSDDRETKGIEGWLFTANQGKWRHFCPECQPLHLESLAALSATK